MPPYQRRCMQPGAMVSLTKLLALPATSTTISFYTHGGQDKFVVARSYLSPKHPLSVAFAIYGSFTQ